MRKTNRSTSIVVAAGLFTVTLSSASHAAECFPGPDFQPPAGTRWQHQENSATNQACWYLEELDASGRREAKTSTRSSRTGKASAAAQKAWQKAADMAAPPAERRDLTSAFKNWFSPKVPDATDRPDAYSDTRQDELKRPAVVPDRTTAKAIPRKTEQRNKTAQSKLIRVEPKSDGTQDHYSMSAIGLLEAAGDKPLPGLPTLAVSDLKTATEAVGDKDVVAAPVGAKEDWQQALYEEFLRWRFKQVLEEKARTIRRELDTAEK
jgi:hypothetical protein